MSNAALSPPEHHTVARLGSTDVERFDDGVLWVNEFGDR